MYNIILNNIKNNIFSYDTNLTFELNFKTFRGLNK